MTQIRRLVQLRGFGLFRDGHIGSHIVQQNALTNSETEPKARFQHPERMKSFSPWVARHELPWDESHKTFPTLKGLNRTALPCRCLRAEHSDQKREDREESYN